MIFKMKVLIKENFRSEDLVTIKKAQRLSVPSSLIVIDFIFVDILSTLGKISILSVFLIYILKFYFFWLEVIWKCNDFG